VKHPGKIPSGAVRPVASTIPAAAHGVLAKMFSKLSSHHAALAGANKPDAQNQPLPAADKVITAQRAGRAIGRQPIYGTPTDPNAL
jgi:hypothetical protein